MLSPLPRRSGWAYCFAHSPQPYQPSPKGLSGRPAHRPFRGLLGVYSRYGLHTRAVTVYRDTLTRGFSHFVTSMTAPVASGWSGCRVGLAPTGKAPPYHGAHPTRTLTEKSWMMPGALNGWRRSSVFRDDRGTLVEAASYRETGLNVVNSRFAIPTLDFGEVAMARRL